MCQLNAWEALSLQLRYKHLDYFRMGIIEEISVFFFEVEDPPRNQKLYVEMMRKFKNKVRGLRRKKG